MDEDCRYEDYEDEDYEMIWNVVCFLDRIAQIHEAKPHSRPCGVLLRFNWKLERL